MLKRRSPPPRRVFAASRLFWSRYEKVLILYREGRPWAKSVTSHYGQRQSTKPLVAISAEAVTAALSRPGRPA